MLNLLLLLAGFLPLIYGAGLLVDNASSLAKRLNIPTIVIGLTIVGFGTSTPEMVVNIFAASGIASDNRRNCTSCRWWQDYCILRSQSCLTYRLVGKSYCPYNCFNRDIPA